MKNAFENQLNDITILILLGDLDEHWRQNVTTTLQSKFPSFLTKGTIQVLQSLKWMYPKLENLTHHYIGHSEWRVKWKAKQNIDFAILWLYVFKTQISKYYLHLEDDVITVKGYIDVIKSVISDQTERWTCLEFSELGMIAKLYHTNDLESLAKVVTLFYEEQPADYTFLHYNPLNLQFERLIIKPTIFQHVGKRSSLFGKIQPLEDRFFAPDLLMRTKGDNPSAILKTSMKFSPVYSPKKAYNARFGYFWSNGPPHKGDYFRIVFDKWQFVKRIIVNSGIKFSPEDRKYDADLETSAIGNATDNCDDFKEAGFFINGTIDVNNSYKTHVRCVQIRLLKSQKNWVIIREIVIFLWS